MLVKEAYSIIAERDCEIVEIQNIVSQKEAKNNELQTHYENKFSSLEESHSSIVEELHQRSKHSYKKKSTSYRK